MKIMITKIIIYKHLNYKDFILIMKNFNYINLSYLRDFSYLFKELKTSKNTSKILVEYMQKSSCKSLKKECEIFEENIKICNFYEAWNLSFKDPLMKVIILTKNLEILEEYVNIKFDFWKSFRSKIIYPIVIFISTLISAKSMIIMFDLNINIYVYLFILLILFISILIHVANIYLVTFTYKKFIREYMYIQYLEQNCSLGDLMEFYSHNIYKQNLHNLQVEKLKSNLNKDYNNCYRVINFIPFLISGFIIISSLLFLVIVLLNITNSFFTRYSYCISP
jgi:hypothetical protein